MNKKELDDKTLINWQMVSSPLRGSRLHFRREDLIIDLCPHSLDEIFPLGMSVCTDYFASPWKEMHTWENLQKMLEAVGFYKPSGKLNPDDRNSSTTS